MVSWPTSLASFFYSAHWKLIILMIPHSLDAWGGVTDNSHTEHVSQCSPYIGLLACYCYYCHCHPYRSQDPCLVQEENHSERGESVQCGLEVNEGSLTLSTMLHTPLFSSGLQLGNNSNNNNTSHL